MVKKKTYTHNCIGASNKKKKKTTSNQINDFTYEMLLWLLGSSVNLMHVCVCDEWNVTVFGQFSIKKAKYVCVVFTM